MHAPLLTAWAGGPKAARLTGKSKDALVTAALSTVRKVFGTDLKGELAAAYAQDWHADPYSRGGYSYVLVGGSGATRKHALNWDAGAFRRRMRALVAEMG